jgi:hypothetical protein
MNDLDTQLADAFERLADHSPHHPDLVGVTRRTARRHRTITGSAITAVALAATVTGLLVIPNSRFGHHTENAPAVPAAATPPCAGTVAHAVLPVWARGGFSDPKPVMPFVTSASGNVVAILFADPLAAPPSKNPADPSNKVLWVWKNLPADPTTLHATARLNGTGPAVTAGLPSPLGPSYVDLPSPGCWRLTLSWPDGSDTIDLSALSPEGRRQAS